MFPNNYVWRIDTEEEDGKRQVSTKDLETVFKAFKDFTDHLEFRGHSNICQDSRKKTEEIMDYLVKISKERGQIQVTSPNDYQVTLENESFKLQSNISGLLNEETFSDIKLICGGKIN